MYSIQIKKITSANIQDLQTLSKQTFYETFFEQNDKEDMEDYLKKNLSIEKLTDELRDADSEFYFAALHDKAIGYLKLNCGKAQTEIKKSNIVELERIYVLKEFLGKGVGQILLDKAIALAHEKRADYIWLGVWEHNPRAVRFYSKNNFVEFDKHIFRLGTKDQTDLMMKLYLKY